MYLAIMAWDPGGRVTKYQDFAEEAEAAAHVERCKADYPEALVTAFSGGSVGDLLVDAVAKSVSVSPPPPVVVSDAERIDAVFPDTDSGRVMFQAFLELVNDVRQLQALPTMTDAELHRWFESKLN